MADAIRAIQVCADYSDASGGTTASVRQFREAMGGGVLAFQESRIANLAAGGTVVVGCNPGVRGRLYRWASSGARTVAETMIADANIVVCHMLYQYHIQWAAARSVANRIPYWVVPHGSLDPYVYSYRSIRKRAWMRMFGHRILRNASRVLFATQRELEKAQEEIGTIANAYVLPWPTARIETTDHEYKRAAVRATLGIPACERVLLYCGRLHSSKRALETIRAVGPLSERGVSLLMIGPEGDVSRGECDALAREHGWTNIRVLGPVYGDSKYDYFKAADALLSLSHKENFGHTVAESLACALPVILSPGVDLASDLSVAGCGWMLPSVDATVVSEVLGAFAAAEHSTLTAMGERGREWAHTRLSGERFADELQRMATDDISRRS